MSAPSADTRGVRWGVVGCGQIALDKAVPGIIQSRNARLVAVCDPDPSRLDRAGELVPDASRYAEAEALLADARVEAVYVATPNFLHAAQAIAAARAGKHVLVEKPMAMNAAEATEMVAAAEAAGVKLMPAYMTLFNPAFESAKRIVDAGTLGEIVFVRGRHGYPIDPDRVSPAAAWRLDAARGGGPLMDVAIYPIFSLRHLTGRRVRHVVATGTATRLAGWTPYDSIVAAVELEDGVPGEVEGTFTHSASTIEIEGTVGRLTLTGHITQAIAGELSVEVRGAQGRPAQRIDHRIAPGELPTFYNYLREIEHFSACILADREPMITGRAAVDDTAVADAIGRALAGGQRVSIDW